MKIVFVSDLHGKYEQLKALPAADLYIVGGDFTTLGTAEQFRNAVKSVEAACPGFRGVVGNMDLREGNEILKETGHLLDEVQEINGVRFAGLGGGNPSPFHTPVEWSEEDMNVRLENMAAVDILVSHTPPHGSGADVISNGAHVGSTAIAAYIQRGKPALVLCGHIHEAAGIYQVDKTFVVNPGPAQYAVVEWNDGKPQIFLQAY